jgi:putative aldouronate transport system substrate-binding protein
MEFHQTGAISRRRLLAAGGGLSAAALLAAAGCGGSPDAKNGSSDVLTLLLPGDQPKGWAEVLAKVNTKLKAERGFTIAPQFISWSNYKDQTLLKFTAGEKFDTALQARWLSMIQLVASKSLTDLAPLLAGGKYPNLSKTLDAKLIANNTWSGSLYGIPQVNSAARLQHFSIRQDLADKVGVSTIADYPTLEKFWYDVKQKVSGVIPMGLSSNMTNLTVIPGPCGLFNAYSWDNPSTIAQSFSGDSMHFVMAADAAQTGSSSPIPFWDAPGMVDAFRTVRKYYLDGIVNKDALNVDSSTRSSLFVAGKHATSWAITDGTSSAGLPALLKAVPTATLANVMPLRGGKSSKPNQTFQSDNFLVLNAKRSNTDKVMQLEDWLSIKENHDIISYGIEGRDWKPVGDDSLEQISDYAFPGFALCWRSSLERRSKLMTASEADWFTWAQDYSNFTSDTFASFIPDSEPVKREDAQMSSAFTQYANPLFFGAVDVDKGLDALKKAADKAGLAKLQAEMQTQADAYLKTKK